MNLMRSPPGLKPGVRRATNTSIGPAIFASIVILNLAAGDNHKAIGYGAVSASIAATS